MKIKNILVLIFLFVINQVFAQTTEAVQVQPSLIVIPFTGAGQDALQLYESDFKWQSIVARINNAFQENGFRPKDLQETINQVKKDKAISNLKEVTTSIEEDIYKASSAEIIVKAIINIHSDATGNSVQISLKAVEMSSRASLYDLPTATCPHFKTDDYGYLVDRVLTEEGRVLKFVNGINIAFGEIVKKGRAIQIKIKTDGNSTFHFNDEIGDEYETLSDQIQKFIKTSANLGQVKIKLNTANELSYDEVRIPLKKEGQNYSLSDYSKELRRNIAKLCEKKSGQKIKMTTPDVDEVSGTVTFILP